MPESLNPTVPNKKVNLLNTMLCAKNHTFSDSTLQENLSDGGTVLSALSNMVVSSYMWP